ncbi:MAG: hypothetical protein IJ805_00830, partial [Lachnospiraceae bacterium]|nr:hypothetical protein [Lachnospiraceae bacterium]
NNGGNKEALDNTDKNAPEQTPDGSAESVSKDAASEDEVKTPAEEGISDNSASDDQVSDNGISDNGISVNDAGLTEGRESEDAVGAAEGLILYVSGNTVSYDGTYKTITVSSNLTGAGYAFNYSIISANEKGDGYKYPSAYKDFSKFTPKPIDVKNVTGTFTVDAIDAGRYAVSVNALSVNNTTNKIISNNVVFLSINKAGPVSISINGATKYYDGTPLKVSSKPYQTGGTLYPRDQNLAAVSDNLTNAGSKYISTNSVKEYLEKNYGKVTVSSGKLTVLSTNLVITTRDFFKNYDGKKVEQKEREGVIYSSPDDVDIKTLSANLGLSANDFIWDKTSLISGDEVSSSENKVSLNSATYERLMKSGNFASIKIKYGTITIQKNTWTSNSLTAPVITTVKQNNKGWITINWKGSKVYKNKEEKDSKKNQARYKIYRYDAEHENWILLNGNNTANEKNKEIDKEYGQTGRSFVDKQAGRYDDSTYIYKVQVVGHDESGVYGMSQPAYKLCQPMPLEVATRQKDAKSIDFEFSKINGAGMYVVEKSSTNKKDSYVTLVSMSASLIRDRKYSGAKLVSAKSYNDKGQLVEKNIKQPADSVFVTDSPVAENTFLFYRVYATASVTDYKENGMPVAGKISVKSDTSASLKGRNTICPPDILSVGSAKYNQTSVVFEMLSTDQIRIGLDKDCAKDKYQILRSTKVDGGYSVVKTITGKQLVGDIEGLKEVKKGTYISINGINLTATKDCYLYTFNNLKPEIRYYYKMRAVRNNVVGAAGNYMSVMPVMDDVTSINAINKNYNQITVSTNYIEGAKQMVITYRAIKDYQGNIINEGSNKDLTWRSKVFPIKMDSKTKKPITEFVVGGLKHGYTYEFYAEPKNGRKHETPVSKRKTDQEYTRVGMAKVKASPKSLTEIYVQWESVPGATSYTLEIWDAEDTKATAPVKIQEFKKAGKHTWKGGTNGVIDGKSNAADLENAGKPYTFIVTATRKDSYFKTGKAGDPSLGVTEAGRPRAVTNLKAAINAVNADAKLTWTACKDNSKNTPIKYMIERDVYRYDTKTVNTFAKTSVSSTIIDYK